MPIFEFTCNACATGRKFSALVGVVAGATPPSSPKCGSTDVRKLISRFARVRSEDDALDAHADQADGMHMDDQNAKRRLVREMASGMGDDMDADEFEAMMDEAVEAEASGAEGDPE